MKHGLIIFLLLCLFHSCQNDNDLIPRVNLQWVSDYRQKMDTDFEFVINVPHAIRSDASVDYATADGTAVADVDYVPTSGKAVIPAGSLSTTIKVKVKGDSLRKNPQIFYLNYSNPTNFTMTLTQAVGEIKNDGLYFPVDDNGYVTPDTYPDYKLMWSDEFNDKSIDENNWTFEQGNNGWGTHELVNYTNRIQNAFVSSGSLIIEARKEDLYGFTSARITTKAKKSFKY